LNIKSGDLIFLVKDETAMQNEHLVEVKEYDCKNNIVKSDKVYTIYKIMQQGGSMGYGLAPGFFIISNKRDKSLINTDNSSNEHWINLNNFDAIGHVTNDDIIKAIREHENNIVVPDINTIKGILGKDVKGS